MSGVVIVGAGQAGLQVAASLRDLGCKEPITLLGAEPALPYQRPPLSKAFLKGKAGEDTLLLKPKAFYEKANVDVRLSTPVSGIDRAAKSVTLGDGAQLSYDHLVLATGARNRTLPIEGAEFAGVHYLRDWAEARQLKAALAGARAVAVIGAGFIGLEFAAVAREAGKPVVVLDVAPRVMGRAVSPAISAHFEAAHRAAGIDLRLSTSVSRILGTGGAVSGLAVQGGAPLVCDLVVIGIGVVPNCELAEHAGLGCRNGILVDRHLLTSDAQISAVGDCAAFPESIEGQCVRLESVQNAVDQAKCVAQRLMGRTVPYAAVPWFWSDQGSMRLQMTGIADTIDEDVMRGDPASGSFSVFRFRKGRLRIVDSVNAPHDHLAARRLVAPGPGVTPAEAADTAFDLKARALGR